MWNRFTAVIAVLACLCSAAHADIVTFSGDTTGSPTFNRPLADRTGLSLVGTSVPYGVTQVSVSMPGSYTFETAATFDSFALLYSTTDPALPLANAVVANDDLVAPPFTTSGFSADLVPGIDYLFVNTGFANTDFGPFASTIGGPGVVTIGAILSPLPERLFVYSGDTTGRPTFNRPLEDRSALSAVGTNVAYDRFDFTVGPTGGSYAFLTTGAFDTFSILYETGFDPSAALMHSLVADDDLIEQAFTTSGFAYALVAGGHYSLITTGFDPLDFGAFSVLVTGPGAVRADSIAAVPEPEAPALLLAGLAAMGWWMRRRRA